MEKDVVLNEEIGELAIEDFIILKKDYNTIFNANKSIEKEKYIKYIKTKSGKSREKIKMIL